MRSQRHGTEPADKQRRRGESADFAHQLESDRRAQPQQRGLLPPPRTVRFPCFRRRTAPGQHEPRQRDERDHAADQGGPTGPGQAERGRAEVAEDEDPIEQHIEQNPAEHDPKRRPRTRLAVQIIPRRGREPRRNQRPRHDERVGLGLLDHPRRLPEMMERGINQVHAQGAKHASDDGKPHTAVVGPRHGIDHPRAVRVRNPHRHRGEHAVAGDGDNHEHIVAESAGGQGQCADMADHHGVGHAHEHLSDLTRGDRRGQAHSRA